MTADRAKCYAKGCPCWPSVQRTGEHALCSAHAWSKPAQWPAITDELIERQGMHEAMRVGRPAPSFTLTPEQRTRLLEALRTPGATDAKAWAYRLRARHEAGATLTAAQIDAYRTVTGGAALPVQTDAWA